MHVYRSHLAMTFRSPLKNFFNIPYYTEPGKKLSLKTESNFVSSKAPPLLPTPKISSLNPNTKKIYHFEHPPSSHFH